MREVPLSEVLTQVKDEVVLEEDDTYVTAGIFSYGRGLFERPPVRGAETTYKSYFRIRSGQFVYSKLFAWEGALGVVDESFDGLHVSPEFPVFDVDRAMVEPAYLRLSCGWEPLWERLRAGETGMGGRRKRVHPAKLLATLLPLPSLEAQRRIVDLLRALDETLQRSLDLSRRSAEALAAFLGEVSTNLRPKTVSLNELATLGSGPSWKAEAEHSAPGGGRVRVLGITNTPQGRGLDLGQEKYVSGLADGTRLLGPGSLLMIRTNGNRARIGNVYRVPPAAFGAAFSAFQIGMVFHDPAHADFAFWMLSAPEVQHAISKAASGTTGLGNIAVKWLKELKLPWPEASERAALVSLFDAMEGHGARSRETAERLNAARDAMLGELLTGDHEIPDSYDELLVGV